MRSIGPEQTGQLSFAPNSGAHSLQRHMCMQLSTSHVRGALSQSTQSGAGLRAGGDGGTTGDATFAFESALTATFAGARTAGLLGLRPGAAAGDFLVVKAVAVGWAGLAAAFATELGLGFSGGLAVPAACFCFGLAAAGAAFAVGVAGLASCCFADCCFACCVA